VALTACTQLGPGFKTPALDIDVPETFQQDGSDGKVVAAVDDRWWKAFNDPALDKIVADVLEQSLDIRKAALRLREVALRRDQTRAERWPSLNLQVQALKQRQTSSSPVLSPAGLTYRQQKVTTDIYSLSLPAAYELDIWGRLSRSAEAAEADLLQTAEVGRVIIQSAIAEAVGLYLQMESLERRIQITQRSIDSYRKSLRFVEKRYERGLTSVLDLRQARRILAQTEAALPSLRQDLGILQQRLAVLMGRYPETRPPRSQEDAYFKYLTPVPPGLPSALLLRRPDVQAAEAQLRALNALVGVAKASRFPRISLTGSYGYSSRGMADILDPASELWNLAAGITQPLFSAGKLRAAHQIARVRYEQGMIDYARTVLTAFLEVERALLTRKEQMERRERVVHLLKEAIATQQAAQSRYERGLVNYLAVLEAQQSRFRAEETLVLVDLAIHANRVTMHRALGGGWGGKLADD